MDIAAAWSIGRLQLNQSPTPDLDARLLLQAVLGVNHAYLAAHGEETLTAVQQKTYLSHIERARKNEPIPYILGVAPFFDFNLTVSPAVLIPRPETEQLVALALEWLGQHPNVNIVDVGTGSGCIPIAIARKRVCRSITAIDISRAALAVAQLNAARLTDQLIHFLHSDLLENYDKVPHLITANLPYVTDSEWTRLGDGVKLHEPALALKGGHDGLDHIRRLLQQARTQLHPDGAIFLEIGWQQGTAVQTLCQQYFPKARTTLHQDFAGQDRIVSIKCGTDEGNKKGS